MTTRRPDLLPPLDLDNPLAAPPTPHPVPRPPIDETRFAAVAAQFETVEAVRRQIEAGRVTVLNPTTTPRSAPAPAPPPSVTPEPAATRRTAPEVALSTRIPDYVMRQLRRRYAEDGTTIRNQILLGLRLAGLEVREEDVFDERKRR